MQINGSVALVTGANRVLKYSTFINAPSLEAARAEMEANYFGTLSMCLLASSPRQWP